MIDITLDMDHTLIVESADKATLSIFYGQRVLRVRHVIPYFGKGY